MFDDWPLSSVIMTWRCITFMWFVRARVCVLEIMVEPLHIVGVRPLLACVLLYKQVKMSLAVGLCGYPMYL